MLLSLINYFKGNVKVMIKGTYHERFFNICTRYNIKLWDIKRKDIETLHVTMGINDFFTLSKVSHKTRSKIKVLEKKGLPFLGKSFKTRYFMWIGLVIFCVLVYITTSRIWEINIICLNECDISKQEIMWSLQEAGVSIGNKTSDIDERAVKQSMTYEYEEIAYISVNIEGNIVNVEIKSKEEIYDLQPEIDMPHKIIADKTGIIYKMDVTEGTAVKKVGETVVEGDLLVDSLVIPRVDTRRYRLVNSTALIDIRTWNEKVHVLPSQIYEKSYTGREKTIYTWVLGENYLYYNDEAPYENYDKFIENSKIYVNSSFILPIRLEKVTYLEYNLNIKEIKEENAYNIMQSGFIEAFEKNLDGEILDIKYDFSKKDDLYILTSKIECIEKVGVKVLDTRDEDILNLEIQKELEEDGAS